MPSYDSLPEDLFSAAELASARLDAIREVYGSLDDQANELAEASYKALDDVNSRLLQRSNPIVDQWPFIGEDRTQYVWSSMLKDGPIYIPGEFHIDSFGIDVPNPFYETQIADNEELMDVYYEEKPYEFGPENKQSWLNFLREIGGWTVFMSKHGQDLMTSVFIDPDEEGTAIRVFLPSKDTKKYFKWRTDGSDEHEKAREGIPRDIKFNSKTIIGGTAEVQYIIKGLLLP